MTYVALLRGINVGGNNKINMQQLKLVFLDAGMQNVTTYINSGNIIFSNDKLTQNELVALLESAILSSFKLPIKVLLRDSRNISIVVDALPLSWKNDTAVKCDVMFLWDAVDKPGLLDGLTNHVIEDIAYRPGAILWRIDRSNVSKSKIPKLVGKGLYKNMTIRNCNTVRAIYAIMTQSEQRGR